MIAARRDTGTAAEGSRTAAALGLADLLCLAGAPVFAIMALGTCVLDAGAAGLLCSAGHGPLTGMAPMYWLMSLFHLAPWLRLISGRRNAAHAVGMNGDPVNFS
ncbi:MAG TPA: hypothetical protein VFG62_10755 [Rhodopila sp.]|nr:hypothetical protein [Rhodopila sp.]